RVQRDVLTPRRQHGGRPDLRHRSPSVARRAARTHDAGRAAVPCLPAGTVPVPPVPPVPVVGPPRADVPDTRRDRLVAPGAAVRLDRTGPGHGPDDPFAVRPLLGLLGPRCAAAPGRGAERGAPVPAGAHAPSIFSGAAARPPRAR